MSQLDRSICLRRNTDFFYVNIDDSKRKRSTLTTKKWSRWPSFINGKSINQRYDLIRWANTSFHLVPNSLCEADSWPVERHLKKEANTPTHIGDWLQRVRVDDDWGGAGLSERGRRTEWDLGADTCFQGTHLWILYHQQFKRFPFAGWWHILLLPATQESEKGRDRLKALDGRNSIDASGKQTDLFGLEWKCSFFNTSGMTKIAVGAVYYQHWWKLLFYICYINAQLSRAEHIKSPSRHKRKGSVNKASW